jgi:predicted nucleic acid-binding protein
MRVFIDSNIPMYVTGRVSSVTLPDTDRARDFLCSGTDISARDAVHAAVMLNNDIERIATFDSGFDRIAGIRRIKLA